MRYVADLVLGTFEIFADESEAQVESRPKIVTLIDRLVYAIHSRTSSVRRGPDPTRCQVGEVGADLYEVDLYRVPYPS